MKREKECGHFIWMDWFKTFSKRLEKSLASADLFKNVSFSKCSLLICLEQCKMWGKKVLQNVVLAFKKLIIKKTRGKIFMTLLIEKIM